MESIVSSEILKLLEGILGGDIKNFSTHVHDPNKKGEGNMSDMSFVSLKNKISDETFHFVVKQAFLDEKLRNAFYIRSNYLNEINFYSKIWPCVDQFQKEAKVRTKFDKIVRCYATSLEEGKETLVLENLRYQNFQNFDKRKAFDKEHIEYIFQQFGRFHATFFAYKTINPEGYSQLVRNQENIHLKLVAIKAYCDILKSLLELCLGGFDSEEDASIIEKLKYYVENVPQIFADSCTYKGKYSTITHGDCWSNNMMFKYDEIGNIADMRLMDFQLCHEASPASELAHCLYSGGTKEMFDQLDYYLKLYHDTFVKTLEEFGLSADVFPIQELKEDWKQHCKHGMFMALVVWKGKTTSEEDFLDLTDMKEEENFASDVMAAKCDQETFRRMTKDVIVHMYENDFL